MRPKEKNELKAQGTAIIDPRFASTISLPIFQSKNRSKAKINNDKRFQAALEDERFRISANVDRYGRKVKNQSERDGFRKFRSSNDKSSDALFDEPDELEKIQSRLAYLKKLSRGEVDNDDESSDEESVKDSNREQEEESETFWNQKEKDIPLGEETKRIAVVNLDWDNVKASDILVLFHSFCPPNGSVKSATIYVSDYGKEMMTEEEKLGPRFIRELRKELNNKNKEEEESDEDNEEIEDEKESDESEHQEENDEYEEQDGSDTGDNKLDDKAASDSSANKNSKFPRRKPGLIIEPEFDAKYQTQDDVSNEIIRQYEFQKLKYYFAIIECNSVKTASVLFAQLDGSEIEHSSSKFDLRFVPDDTSFEGRDIKDSCDNVPSNYRPADFVFKALQQSRVECSWDQPDNEQLQTLTSISKWKDLEETDFQAFLPSSSDNSDNEEDTEEKQDDKSRLRKLLLGDEFASASEDDFFVEPEKENRKTKKKNNDNGNMEITFVPELEDRLKEKTKKKLILPKKEETVFEAFQRKKKEKKNKKNGEQLEVNQDDEFFLESSDKRSSQDKQREKAELELLLMDDENKEEIEDFDVKELVRQEKTKGKKLSAKQKRKEMKKEKMKESEFKVDVKDARFAAVFEGDPRFGLDVTSKDFKPTEGIKQIFAEQNRRKVEKRQKKPNLTTNEAEDNNKDSNEQVPLKSLVEKLKHNTLKRKLDLSNNNNRNDKNKKFKK